MQKCGLTAAGTQRWYCNLCRSSAVKNQPDTQARHHRTLFIQWLTGNRSLTEIALIQGVTRQTLVRWFSPLSALVRHASPIKLAPCASYILDGVYVSGRENATLICRAMDAQILWQFAERETLANWMNFLKKLPAPDQMPL